jgi:alkaline phosphatase D
MKLLLTIICSLQLLSLSAQHVTKSVKPCLAPFYHGVASGDPLSDRVILWTRYTPDSLQSGQQIVEWKIAEDTSFSLGLQSGVVITDETMDYTVKVDPTGLTPNTTYYYQFKANDQLSVIGRTRTATSGDCDSLRFAVVSCANFEAGYFNVFRNLKERNDFDAVICLGDYIYEYESGGYAPNPSANRQWMPTNEILSLLDYRARYSTYRLDDDLRDLHQQFPFIVVWDDHETANDSWMNGAENHQANEGSFANRKQAAKQAYFEWLPIRVTGVSDNYQIFREIKYGDLVDLIMLDTRLHGRDEQAGTSGATVNAQGRQLLGTDQFTWLGTRLSNSTSRWKLLGQQVMMAPLTIFGAALNGDQWDGYPAERQRVYNHILTNNITDVVVLTGDIHSSWANDLPGNSYNGSTGGGSVGVEFVAPSVTSPGINIPGGATAIMASNSHIKYADLSLHGYVMLDVNKQRVQADWYYVNTIDNPSGDFTYGTSFTSDHLTRHLVAANSASIPRNGIQGFQTENCPYYAPNNASLNEQDQIVFLGVYPNPVVDVLFINVSIPVAGDVSFSLVDLEGKLIQLSSEVVPQSGSFQFSLDLSKVATGNYFLRLETTYGVKTVHVVKQ